MNRTGLIVVITLLSMGFVFQGCETKENYQTPQSMLLNSGWTFKMEGESNWLPAEVPGTVHTDLLANNKIPQPFYRDNEKSLQWIDKKNWIYRCEFMVDTLHEQYTQALMDFKGLDTYAEVSLNGIAILSADNMFRNWVVDVSKEIQPGENTLEIRFNSPIEKGLQALEEFGYTLPASNDQSENGELGDKKVSIFTRKAPYHYGWDWGPRFVTSGVWRDIELTFVNHLHIENAYYKQNNILPQEATIDAVVNLDVVVDGDYTVSITSPNGATTYASINLYLEKGSNSVTLPFRITNPDLWWPNGMGDPNLYSFHAKVANSLSVLDTLTTKVGLRSVRLVREPDSLGKSFYFEINGKPVFAKGANYIPNDNFLPRVTTEKYEHIITSAVDANMNMLRVWGGGIYENDIFYELCDKYGIMVWQDFMFACSMYPGDDDFLQSVYREATDNIIRLRNHPSIVLWCGNNEMHAAWCQEEDNCGWGWKQRYTTAQREAVWHAYDTLFHKILPDLVQTYDGLRDYWPSSPQADWGKKATYHTTSGDIHYWGVWHGQEPFSEFYNVVGRFMSEYGFQSFPDMQSVKKFTLPHDWDTESEVMKAHQRSGLGNTRIVEYMSDLYPVPTEFDDVLYVGQILQAEGIKQAIHAHRAKKPYCMGTLYWQLNDCWPAASWSSIDYYGSWKALQYYARQAYKPVIFAFIPEDEKMILSVCSDLSGPVDAEVSYRIRTFKGQVLDEKSFKIRADHAKTTHVDTIDLVAIRNNFNPEEVFLEATLLTNETTLANDVYYFAKPKDLQLPTDQIEREVEIRKNKLSVTLKSGSLVRNVYLTVEKHDVHFSDNYFDLLPGKSYTVMSDLPVNSDAEDLKITIKTLNSILDEYR